MDKTEALKKELENLGIHNLQELKEAMKHTSIDISLMAADLNAETKEYRNSLCG